MNDRLLDFTDDEIILGKMIALSLKAQKTKDVRELRDIFAKMISVLDEIIEMDKEMQ